MNKIKTRYFLLALVISVFLGILVTIPQVIPSWVFVQQVIIVILYLLNIVLAYMIIVRFKNFIRSKQKGQNAVIFTGIIAVLIIGGLFISFIITSLGIGQGFMGGSMAKELDYPSYKVKIYLYDDSFLDPLTSIKIKKKFWPVMENLEFIEHCQPEEVKIWRHSDTVEIVHGHIAIKINLLTRKAQKIYSKTSLTE